MLLLIGHRQVLGLVLHGLQIELWLHGLPELEIRQGIEFLLGVGWGARAEPNLGGLVHIELGADIGWVLNGNSNWNIAVVFVAEVLILRVRHQNIL